MEQTWRWFGDRDMIPLSHVRQAGATSVVTALHHIRSDDVWSPRDIEQRKSEIEAAGLKWRVCESIPIPDAIKLGGAAAQKHINIWKDTLANLGRAGIAVVCYNFMPVVDWTRTDLMFKISGGGYALRFDMVDFVGYDVFVLKRKNAAADYNSRIVSLAEIRISEKSEDAISLLERNIIAGLPGGSDSHTRQSIAALIASFGGMDATTMRDNLLHFLREVVPVAQAVGVRLAIHPDDPPISLFGLPRVVSTAEDARTLLNAVDTPSNGLTLCTGSYGSRPDNNLVVMAAEFASRINFAHLRNVTLEPDGSFFEAEHLNGCVDMVGVIEILLREERKATRTVPMRPDHGHLLADDIMKKTNPGYSYIGRLKGLAELRGVMSAVEHGVALEAAR